MSTKHHVHMHIPTRLNAWLTEEADLRGKNKTAIVVELIEKEMASEAEKAHARQGKITI